MSGKDEKLYLELALAVIEAIRKGHPFNFDSDDRIGKMIAEAAHPILYKRWRALNGRPGASGAGEMVQAFIDSGMPQTQARRLVQARMAKLRIQMKLASIAASHRRFLATTDKPAMRDGAAAEMAAQRAIKVPHPLSRWNEPKTWLHI